MSAGRHVLLLRLAGPMQSWGTQSRFPVRDTGREPSKSGVVGLLCAALGRPRHLSVDDLAALRMGVRVDAEGIVAVDFQTAGGTHRRGDRYGVRTADGTPGDTVVSQRYYLADADFLVGLEGPDIALLEELSAALARPVWALSLGRKAFAPGLPVRHPDGGIRRDHSLEAALAGEPWPKARFGQRLPTGQEGVTGGTLPPAWMVIEVAPENGGDVRLDQPIGAAFADRRFALRHVLVTAVPAAKLGSPEQATPGGVPS